MTEPLLTEPAAIFMTIMAVILIAPLITKWAHLPGIVGLIFGGILVGQHGLNLLVVGDIIELFATVGLIYLMFNAGLEIDLGQFRKVRNQSIYFAILNFLPAQLSGILIGRLFGMDWTAAILLGSVYASHTLVAYPILSNLGIIRNDSVAITIGATVFTDILALLILAVITGSQGGEFSLLFLFQLIGLTVLYAAFILLGIPRLGNRFFQRFSGRAIEFQFVLVVLFVAAVLADQIGMHTIVGAFLAGLAINATLSRESKVVGQVLFLGESFFVPLFLMTVGMRLDPLAIVANTRTILVGLSLTGAVYTTKFAASWAATRLFDFSRDEMFTSWGLTQAQAAATLATILVGREAGIFPEYVFNGAILMILITSITSPFIVERFGKGLKPPKEEDEERPLLQRVLVPISQSIPEHLLDLASFLTRKGDGEMLIINMAQNENELKSRREKLKADILKDPDTDYELLDRIESSLPGGVLKVALEGEASLILLAWQEEGTGQERIFSSELDEILWESRVPVFLAHLTTPINALERVLLVVAATTVGVKFDKRSAEAAQTIAESLELPLITLATSHYNKDLERSLGSGESNDRDQLIRLPQDPLAAILEEVQEQDLVILPAMGSQDRFHASEDHLPYQLTKNISSSILITHFP